MNLKGCGRKWSEPNLLYYSGICLDGLSETTKNLSSACQYPRYGSHQIPSVYQLETLQLEQTFLGTGNGT